VQLYLFCGFSFIINEKSMQEEEEEEVEIPEETQTGAV